MKKVIGVWILLCLAITGLYSQSIWSKTWNSGSTDYTNSIKSSHLVNDTLYYVTFNACDVQGQTFNECNTIGIMDDAGNTIAEKLFNNISIKEHGNIPWVIENDRIILGDGTGKGQPSHYDVHFISKSSLEYLKGFKYEFQDSLDQLFVTGLVAFDNYYVLSGMTQLKDTAIYPDFLVWIDKETMILDTIIEYLFEKEVVIPEFVYAKNDSLLTVYFSGLGLRGLNDSRGFVKIDQNKEFVFKYLDTIDLSTNLEYPHSGLLLDNGNMIYKQRYDSSEQPWPTTWGSDFDIVCINPQGEIIWRFNNPGSSYTNALGLRV